METSHPLGLLLGLGRPRTTQAHFLFSQILQPVGTVGQEGCLLRLQGDLGVNPTFAFL